MGSDGLENGDLRPDLYRRFVSIVTQKVFTPHCLSPSSCMEGELNKMLHVHPCDRQKHHIQLGR